MDAHARQKGRVLVVDDEPDILESIAATLRRKLRDVEVLEASGGRRALGIIAQGGIDVVFTDFRMAGMDGLEFLAAAHQLDRDLPGIVCTAYPDLHIVERALNEERIRKFFIKPVEGRQIVEGVAEVLWEHRRDQLRDAVVSEASDLIRGATGDAGSRTA